MRYCQYCGTQLEDGAQCTCPESQKKKVNKADYQGALKEILPYYKSYFNDPKEAKELKNRENGFPLSVLLGGAFVISVIILFLFYSGQVIALMKKSMGSYSDLVISYPYGAALVTGLIVGAVILGLSALTLVLCDELGGREKDFKESYMVVAAQLPFPTLFILISGILSPLTIKGSCIVLSLSSLIWIILGITEIQQRLGALNESKKNIFVSMAIIFIFNFVVCYIIYKLMFWTIGTIRVDGEKLSDYMDYFLNNIFRGFL